jgi:radical SAM protein with 4Fe4S-binding SPASM domain
MQHESKQQEYQQVLVNCLKNNEDPYPLVVEFHPSAACNHHCPYCFNPKKNADTLPFEVYRQIFKELHALGIQNISFGGGGEPFVNSEFSLILQEAFDCGFAVRIVTNGTLLRQKHIPLLLQTEELRISIDAATAVTHHTIRKIPITEYAHVLHVIKTILEKRETAHPHVGVTFIIQEKNKHEIADFFHEFKKIGVDSIIYKQDILSPFQDFSIPQEIQKDPQVETRIITNPIPGHMRCAIPYLKIAIDPKGRVYSCCLGAQKSDNTPGYLLGDIREQSFATIWKTSHPLRKRLLQEKTSCSSCNYSDSKNNREISALMNHDRNPRISEDCAREKNLS